jgi:hypothetical protein
MTDHNITPPPELVQQWAREIYDKTSCGYERDEHIATRAAQWGADQELEACCALMDRDFMAGPSELRAARRPKPPSLKAQALDALQRYTSGKTVLTDSAIDTIRRALNQLPDS